MQIEFISIHAPSRERPTPLEWYLLVKRFQSTLPRGSDGIGADDVGDDAISIHAPSRERQAALRAFRIT